MTEFEKARNEEAEKHEDSGFGAPSDFFIYGADWALDWLAKQVVDRAEIKHAVLSISNIGRGTTEQVIPVYKISAVIQAQAERIRELEGALGNLRKAQKAYMADRGNNELGKIVALRAAEADKALGGEW